MTFDDWFVVRNVKIIQGTNGLFIAMPSRKAVEACVKCGFKNARGSRYCNQCGKEISGREQARSQEETAGEKQGGHMDIAHPVTQECRLYIQKEILEAYNNEITRKNTEGSSYTPANEKDLDTAARVMAKASAPARNDVPAGVSREKDQDIEL
jgi:stage V sporulation protein G